MTRHTALWWIERGLIAVGAGAMKSTIGLNGALAGTGVLLFVSALLLLRLRLERLIEDRAGAQCLGHTVHKAI